MKKSERTFAQRAIHSLQDSRSSLTEADVWKSSSPSTTWTNDPPGNEIKKPLTWAVFLRLDGCSEYW